MKYCPRCGNMVEQGMRYCNKCGFDVSMYTSDMPYNYTSYPYFNSIQQIGNPAIQKKSHKPIVISLLVVFCICIFTAFIGFQSKSSDQTNQVSKVMSESKFAQYVSDENLIYYLLDDYDGDGLDEAFAITGDYKTDYRSDMAYMNVKLYFLSSEGSVENTSELRDGFLYDFNEDDSYIISVSDTHKVFQWLAYNGGSGAAGDIFGVKNGEAYQLNFHYVLTLYDNENYLYYGIQDDFSLGSHGRIYHIMSYDAFTGELIDTGDYIRYNSSFEVVEKNF